MNLVKTTAALIAAAVVLVPSTRVRAGAFTAPTLDFDGDLATDVVVTRSVSVDTIWYVANASGVSGSAFGSSVSNERYAPADYDGDGKTDKALYRATATSGTFWIQRSTDGAVIGQTWGVGMLDYPMAGDYDGDQKADIALYRKPGGGANNFYFVQKSTDGSLFVKQWGGGPAGNFDEPIAGDYDGDGKADFAVRRPGAGGESGPATFYIFASTAGEQSPVQWGINIDDPVPGDYDGDGKTDVAIVRDVSGIWRFFIRRSTDGGLIVRQFGFTTDLFAPGDYDGDGTTDFAVWRHAGLGTPATFYATQSGTGGFVARQFGQGGDFPMAWFILFQTHFF